MKARADEIAFIDQLHVWDIVPLQMCFDRTGKPPLGTRWLDHNKGDSRQLDLRSRLVVQETKKVSSILADDIAGVFSATPPLEALRFIFSLCMSLPPLAGQIFTVRFLDVSRAHPHCVKCHHQRSFHPFAIRSWRRPRSVRSFAQESVWYKRHQSEF